MQGYFHSIPPFVELKNQIYDAEGGSPGILFCGKVFLNMVNRSRDGGNDLEVPFLLL
jgi:hypothetical protein